MVKILSPVLVWESWAGVGGPGPVLVGGVLLDLGGRLIVVVVVVVAVGAVALHWGRNHYTLGKVTCGLETHGVGAVLNNLDFAIGVDVSVLALDTTVSEPGL